MNYRSNPHSSTRDRKRSYKLNLANIYISYKSHETILKPRIFPWVSPWCPPGGTYGWALRSKSSPRRLIELRLLHANAGLQVVPGAQRAQRTRHATGDGMVFGFGRTPIAKLNILLTIEIRENHKSDFWFLYVCYSTCWSNGSFLKEGYPQSSSISRSGFSLGNPPILGYLPD